MYKKKTSIMNSTTFDELLDAKILKDRHAILSHLLNLIRFIEVRFRVYLCL